MKNTIFKIFFNNFFFTPNYLMGNTEYFEEGLIFLKTKNLMKQNLNLNKI